MNEDQSDFITPDLDGISEDDSAEPDDADATHDAPDAEVFGE